MTTSADLADDTEDQNHDVRRRRQQQREDDRDDQDHDWCAEPRVIRCPQGRSRADRRPLDQPQARGAVDGIAPAGDPQLAVQGDRLGLHRIARDEGALADLAERQMGRQERKQPELRAGQARALAGRASGIASTSRWSSPVCSKRPPSRGRCRRIWPISDSMARAPSASRSVTCARFSYEDRAWTASHGRAYVRDGVSRPADASSARASAHRL